MEYSENIKTIIQDYLDRDEWHYTFDEEQHFFKAGIKLDGKLNRCDIIIDIREEYYLVYGMIALSADEKCLNAILEYIHRINYGLKFGSFELDLRDGEIRYKMYVDCGNDCDCMPSESVIQRSLEMPALMFEKYGDGFLNIMFGNVSPEEAIKMVEEETE